MNLMTEVGTLAHQQNGPPRLHPYGTLMAVGRRKDGGIERVYSVKHRAELPPLARARSVFMFPFRQLEERLVMVRVDGDRYSLIGGRIECFDTSLEGAARREFGEEAQGEIEGFHVLGFSEVFPANGNPYIAVYFTVRVVRLNTFIASEESDERFEVVYDSLLLNCMGGRFENKAWVRRRTKLLLAEAMRRGRHLPKEAKTKKRK